MRAMLLTVVAFVSVSALHADLTSVGFLAFNTLIPSDITTPGINIFSIGNLTGDPALAGYALPPDFPVNDFLVFGNSSLTWYDQIGNPTTILLGDLGPGFYSPDSLQVSDATSITSAIFTATLSQTVFSLSGGGTFTAFSSAINVSLTPSGGPFLAPDLDTAPIEISGVTATSTPEPSLYWLTLLAGALLVAVRTARALHRDSAIRHSVR